jgi:predicted hydrocarbon binding protein
MDQNPQLQNLQGLMVFLASASNGLEHLLGRGAPSITFRAGRTAGLKLDVQQEEKEDLVKALDHVWDEMCRIGMKWAFEPYKKASESELITEEDGKLHMKLVFRNCMVRSSLFRYGHPQKLSLCMMNHGLFCGLLEKVYGARANLEILHAGENACIKLLTVEKRK